MDKVICVGKNYLKHAAELGDAINEEPLFFLKPPSVCTQGQGSISLPKEGDIHHEVELVFQVQNGQLSQFTIGLDLTIRDLQARLKKAGHPWEKGKVFKNSAVLGPWQKLTDLESLMNQQFSISVNGEIRQTGFGRDMRWKPNELIQEAGRWFPICDGDLLFTGTPEGVGPLEPGDRVEVRGPGIEYSFQIQS